MHKRLDIALTGQGLAPSRQKAQEWIRDGRITVNGQRESKPSRLVADGDALAVSRTDPYVSRAGYKLAHALEQFGLSVQGLSALDVGASTGGFTDCLLQHGAKRVWAVDVGHGQLAACLRGDPRVVNLEGVNARALQPDLLGEPAQLAVLDVSFISQRLVLPAIRDCLTPEAMIVSLVKPQFEAGRGFLDKRGVIRDAKTRERVLRELMVFLPSIGLSCERWIPSPLCGGDGNIEYLMLLRQRSSVFSGT